MLLPADRESVSIVVRPGAILFLIDEGGLFVVDREGFIKLKIEGAIS
jgi:hypothetical protein